LKFDVKRSAKSRSQVPNRFFTYDHVNYEDFINFLKIYTLHNRRVCLDASFLISDYPSLKCCPSLLDSAVLEMFFVILATPPCLLLLVETLRPSGEF